MRTLPRSACQTYHQHTPTSDHQRPCCTVYSYYHPNFEPKSPETFSCCYGRDRIMANKTSPNTTLLCLYTNQQEADENIEYSERMSEVIPVNYAIWKLGFMLLFLAITVYTCIELYKRVQAERKSSIQNFNLKEFLYKPKNTTLSLILIASFLLTLCVIDPHERSEAFWGHIYGTGRQGRAAVEIL